MNKVLDKLDINEVGGFDKLGYWEIFNKHDRCELFHGNYFNAVQLASLYVSPSSEVLVKQVKVSTIEDIRTRLDKAKTRNDIENEITRLQEQLANGTY
jgi:hypothetical protein